MATVTGSYKTYKSDGTVYSTITERITYTITNYDNRAVINFTKYEAKTSLSTQDMLADGLYIYAYNSSGDPTSTSVSVPAITLTSSYKTRWSGTKSVTCYKGTSSRNVTANSCKIAVGTLTAYTLTYSASGATGVPSAQTKYYGTALTLRSNVPTKTGYTFASWTNSYDSKTYLAGASYPAGNNGNSTLTAQWTANKYTIPYNANGGTGTVASQTKTYNTALTLRTASGFTRTGTISGVTCEYEVISWNTKADGSGTTYSLGGSAPNISSNLTLYAIWAVKYKHPYITSYSGYRTETSSIDDTQETSMGEYIYIEFDFLGFSNDGGSTYSVPSCTITIDEDVYTQTLSFSTATGGNLKFKPNALYSRDTPHNIIIKLSDPNRAATSYTRYEYVFTAIYPFDMYADKENDKVYMGVMHPYVLGQTLTVPETYFDNNIHLNNMKHIYLNKDLSDSYNSTEIHAETYAQSGHDPTNNLYLTADGYLAFYAGDDTHSPTGRVYVYYDETRILNELCVQGHSSPIGTVKYASLSSNKSVSSGNSTGTMLCSISLEAGTWSLVGGVRWATNASGFRRINLHTTSGSNEMMVQIPPMNGEQTQMIISRIVTLSSTTTIYLNGLQNSGGALNAIAGGNNWGTYITAVRIA